ncbi:uncharacterized protein LOC133328137 [Musca vetustissima]|uniref:uncharacterized protein LOC133328137 n=1 Tax=Musca vetustissima TaxID=27455 RepID=UPI002AB698AD|nr:uncharacterized protein LOC133328137 [Musca vetustissima]
MDPHILNISSTNISRSDIINFPFPYKLWLVINMDFCEFLRWNRDGTVALLDLPSMQEYLNSMRSIFKIKNCSVFLQHLVEFKFERLNVQPEDDEDIILQYKHESFQRYRLDLLANVRRVSTKECLDSKKDAEESPSNKEAQNPQAMISEKLSKRMLGDLCFMSHGSLSEIQKSRLRFQTIFNFQNETRLLREKIRIADEIAERNKRSRLVSPIGNNSRTAMDDDQVIEVSADLYENPHDSVLNFADDFRPEYAGYYGNVSKDMLVNFFGEYLPTYADGTMEVQKIIADNSGTQTTIAADTNADAVISYDMAIPTTNDQAMNDLHFSSALQPIFKTENNEHKSLYENQTEFHIFSENVVNINDNGNEIALDEFLKFKDPLALHSNDVVEENKENINTETDLNEFLQFKDPLSLENNHIMEENKEKFNEMPQCSKNCYNTYTKGAYPKLKLDENKNKEDEANFRSFFRQYKASLNLLYDN